MNRTIKLFPAFVLTALILSSCGLGKMVKNYPQVKYQAQPEVLETHGGKIAVKVDGTIPEKYFHKKAVVEITPYLEFEGGTKELGKTILKGEKAVGDGKVISKKTGGSFSWSETFAYDPKYNASDLKLKATATLGKEPVTLGILKIGDGVIYTSTRTVNDEELLVADRATAQKLGMDLSEYYEKETIVKESADIFFVVNKDDLNFRYELNKGDGAKAALEELKNFMDREWKVKDITINAWASPEGEESLNQGLSERRSKSARKYVEEYYKAWQKTRARELKVRPNKVELPEVSYVQNARGEDWDGFLGSVERSGLKDKNVILNVVRSQKDLKQREQEIRNMTLIYKEIEDQILPPLRRAEITVSCYEPKRTDEEIARLSTTTPDSLDLKELIHAASLTQDMATKLAIHKAAAKAFPSDWKPYANIAYVELANGNLDEAGTNLDKANTLSPNNPIILNNLGALAAKKGDDAAAKSFYSQAKGKGVDVNYNSGILQIKDGNYSAALTSFGSKTCNYNVALAQILSSKLTEAAKNLECAPENAEVFYLLAVVNARQNNASGVNDYLKKAIAADGAYKAQAAKDREFLEYFQNADFQAIVK
jgi:outer membrane protein OmpA-like peptidoglycan-associated protein